MAHCSEPHLHARGHAQIFILKLMILATILANERCAATEGQGEWTKFDEEQGAVAE